MTLEDDLRQELSWIVTGSTRPEDDARLAVRTILARHGFPRAPFHVALRQGQLHVDVDLPPSPARVTAIRLRLS